MPHFIIKIHLEIIVYLNQVEKKWAANTQHVRMGWLICNGYAKDCRFESSPGQTFVR